MLHMTHIVCYFILTGGRVLLRVEHLLQIADLVEQFRGRVLGIEVALATGVANHLLVDHHVGVDPCAVVASRLVARHEVLVVPADARPDLLNQGVSQQREIR